MDSYYATSPQGVFAVGDVHGDIKLISVAWADGDLRLQGDHVALLAQRTPVAISTFRVDGRESLAGRARDRQEVM